MDILTMEEIHIHFAFIICEINFSFVGCKIWEGLIYLFVTQMEKCVCVFIDDQAESIKSKTENREKPMKTKRGSLINKNKPPTSLTNKKR